MVSTALDAVPTPPCAQLLGWRILDARPEEGWNRIGFHGKPEFRNPAGLIQGGILSAMLDDTMGPTKFVKTNGRFYTYSDDPYEYQLSCPAKVGPILGDATALSWERPSLSSKADSWMKPDVCSRPPLPIAARGSGQSHWATAELEDPPDQRPTTGANLARREKVGARTKTSKIRGVAAARLHHSVSCIYLALYINADLFIFSDQLWIS
jgi:hypothetical protein